MKNWLLWLIKPGHCAALEIGATVKTPHGEGVVIGGCVQVRLLSPSAHQRSIHQLAVGCNLDKVEVL